MRRLEKIKKAIDALTWTLLGAFVLGYIAFVAASVCGRCGYTMSNSQIRLKKLAMAIDTFVVDTGKLPPDLGALIVAETVGWRGPSARGGDLIDPWGDPIRYQVAPGTAPGYRLVCVCQGQSIALSN